MFTVGGSRRLGNDKFIRLSAEHFLSELSGIGKIRTTFIFISCFAGSMIDLMRLCREVGGGYRDDDDGVSLYFLLFDDGG
jgi:hypothetical protein